MGGRGHLVSDSQDRTGKKVNQIDKNKIKTKQQQKNNKKNNYSGDICIRILTDTFGKISKL